MYIEKFERKFDKVRFGIECLSIRKFSGDNIYEETPVPISNTEVKLIIAENTCELPCWEDKMSPVFYSPIAQLVERSAVNR